MRKQDKYFKTHAGSLYGKMGEIAMREAAQEGALDGGMDMREVASHITMKEFYEDMIPDTTTCNICGKLITKKMGMMPCGPYHSGKTGNYVCMHCYGKYVQPLIDGLAEMERTTHREELMEERKYRC